MYNIDDVIFDCAVEALSSILGKKWVAAIIWTINEKKVRFGELQRSLDGCSKKMTKSSSYREIKNDVWWNLHK